MVRRDQGVLEPAGQSQSTFGYSSDAETCGTGMENALGRNAGLHSGSCFCSFLAEPAFGRRRRRGGPHHSGGGERGPLRGFERVTGSRCFVFKICTVYEETRKYFSIVLIHQEKFFTSELSKVIQRNLVDPSLQEDVLIPDVFFKYIYHVGCAITSHSTINSEVKI